MKSTLHLEHLPEHERHIVALMSREYLTDYDKKIGRLNQRQIAEIFDVSDNTVGQIYRNERLAHVQA